jgi:hypothetical protein
MQAECSKKIINAHTVSKSANLKKLAVNGHVYGFRPSLQALIKGGGKLAPELIGINSASTFTGFCAHHDKSIFSEIEDEPMQFTDAQCFKLAYRTVGREEYLKTNQIGAEGLMRSFDRGAPLEAQIAIQMHGDDYFAGVSAGARTTTRHKKNFDNALLTADYSGLKKCVLEFDSTPTVMAAFSFYPEFDFHGQRLQTLLPGRPEPELLCCNVIATESSGAVVFTWLESSGDKACRSFVNSLLKLPKQDVTDYLIRFFFEHCENTFMAPTWWEELPERQRESLATRLVQSGTTFRPRTSSCLMDDGLRFDDWGFVKAWE